MANWARRYLEANPNLAAMPVVRRASHSLHLRRPDGKIEAHCTQVPCHYQDGNGTWQELDTALVDGGTFWYAPGTRPRIAKSNRRVSLTNGTYSQTTSRVGLLNPTTGGFRSLWTIPAGTVDGDSVVSGTPNSYEHRITVTENGLRETLTLLNNPGGMGAQPGEWLVIETLVEGTTFQDGWVEEFSASGEYFPLPTATDANGDVPLCRRYAKQASGSQYLYTGVLASWFATAAYPVVVDPDITAASSGYVYGNNADYATARSTSTSGGTTSANAGQFTGYTIRRGFLKFDTSSTAGTTIDQVNLKLTASLDSSTTDFDTQIVKADWSSCDPLASGNWETAYDICGSATVDALWRNTSGMAVNTPYTSANLDTAWINQSGSTYYGLRSKEDTDSSVPTTPEGVYFYAETDGTAEYRPILVIVYGDTVSGTAQWPGTAATSAATAPYDDDDWTAPNNAKANDGSYASVDPFAAASAGPNYPNGTLTTVNTTAPYDDLDWDDKVGVGADDTDYASITSGSFDTNVITYLGKAQGYGFTIPTRAVITGIEVVVAKSRSAGTSCVDSCVQLLDGNGALFGNNKADGATNWPSSITGITYGGAGDMWGLNTSTLTPAIVNDADFGVGIAVKATANNVDANVDYITVKVYYNDPTFDTNDYSYLLKLSNFPFVIPTEATVTGVKVTVERKAVGTIKDAIVKLLDGSGAVQGNDKADTSTAWPGSDTVKDYGGDGDTWGATVTPAVINDIDFGVAIAVKAEANDSAAYIDYVSMTVYYTVSSGTTYNMAAIAAGVGATSTADLARTMSMAPVAAATGLTPSADLARIIAQAASANSVTVTGTPTLLSMVILAAAAAATGATSTADLARIIGHTAAVNGIATTSTADLLRIIGQAVAVNATGTTSTADLLRIIAQAAAITAQSATSTADMLKLVGFTANVNGVSVTSTADLARIIAMAATIAGVVVTSDGELTISGGLIHLAAAIAAVGLTSGADLARLIGQTSATAAVSVTPSVDLSRLIAQAGAVAATGATSTADLARLINMITSSDAVTTVGLAELLVAGLMAIYRRRMPDAVRTGSRGVSE